MTPRGPFLHLLLRLRGDNRGTMAIETVIVAPVLAFMAIGIFEVGTLVSRQQELQSSASEAESIVLAAAASSGTDSATIEAIIEDSLGLRADQVTLEQRFRCNTASSLTTDASTCDSSQQIYQYVRVQVTDTYTPVWARFGVGEGFDYNVLRTVQVQ